jgi:hypothetical protein
MNIATYINDFYNVHRWFIHRVGHQTKLPMKVLIAMKLNAQKLRLLCDR